MTNHRPSQASVTSECKQRTRLRSGYTLFELLLVLMILLIVVGFSWQFTEIVFYRHRLLQTAEDVRIRLAASRTRAIESGVILQFLYESHGRRYTVRPSALGNPSDALPPPFDGELPDSMRFEPARTVDIGNVSSADATNDAEYAAPNWSAPILFAPDGTAIDAAFDLVDDTDRRVRISVRGLTAAVSVGNVEQGADP